MKRTLKWLCFLCVTVMCFGGVPAYAETQSELLPPFVLPIPDNPSHRSYLGLSGQAGGTFAINDIDADILLIELFSMYCPFCQEEAPLINELYGLMQELPPDSPSVKIIGLGAGNSEFEVDHFRQTYEVEFPLFADTDLHMYQELGGEGTPGFIGATKNQEQKFIIIFRQAGGFYDAQDFLDQLIELGRKQTN